MAVPLPPPPPLLQGSDKRAKFQAIWDQMCDPASLWDSKLPPLLDINVAFGNLKALPCIGRGRFGEVRVGILPGTKQLQQKQEQLLCAIKIVNKQSILTTWQQLVIRAERDALVAFASDEENRPRWCSRLHYCVQDETNLYFVMDFEPGGDLCSLVYSASPLSEQVAAFYVAELALAIHTLHEKTGYTHRDIKPANIVLEQFGHLRLIDFGTARITNDKQLAYDLVGTPEYVAPEVYLCDSNHGYSHSCDWWSFGVCAYEILTGVNPFRCIPESAAETKYKIINWKDTLKFPNTLSEFARELLAGVLASDQQRLQFLQIRSLPFFKCIDWDALNTCRRNDFDSSASLLEKKLQIESPLSEPWRCNCCCWRQKPKKQPTRTKNIRRVDNILTQELGPDGRPCAPWRPTFESCIDTRWFGNFANMEVPDFTTSVACR